MLFLIKSDIIEHLFFYFCFFFYRSLQLLFKPNQTQKKKKFQIPESHKSRKKSYLAGAISRRIEIAIDGAISPSDIAPDRDRDRRRDCAGSRSRSTSRSRLREIVPARSRRREIATLGEIAPSRDRNVRRDRAGEI